MPDEPDGGLLAELCLGAAGKAVQKPLQVLGAGSFGGTGQAGFQVSLLAALWSHAEAARSGVGGQSQSGQDKHGREQDSYLGAVMEPHGASWGWVGMDSVIKARSYPEMAGAGGEKRTGKGRHRLGDRGQAHMKKPGDRGLAGRVCRRSPG